jgi:hypothetical protein
MKPDQRFTPKYWVFHNTKTDDVYLETAAKSFAACKFKVEQYHIGKLCDFYENDESQYQISLIEIKLFSEEVADAYREGILAIQSKIYKP